MEQLIELFAEKDLYKITLDLISKEGEVVIKLVAHKENEEQNLGITQVIKLDGTKGNTTPISKEIIRMTELIERKMFK